MSPTFASVKLRVLLLATLSLLLLLGSSVEAQKAAPAADTSALEFKQFGLLAIQDNGRRKPIDTFAREALIKISGRSTYKAANGKRWQATDLVLSAFLETHDWKSEPMILVSLGNLIEQLGLDKTKRRFSFAELSSSAELKRLENEVRALQRAEKSLSRLQAEARNVIERRALMERILNGSAFLIIPAPTSVNDAWVIPQAFGHYYKQEQFAIVQSRRQAMEDAYRTADSSRFSNAAAELREAARALSPAIYPAEKELRVEYAYNHFKGFYRAAWCYGVALLVLGVAHARRRGAVLRNLGVGLAFAGVLLHGAAIVMRCMIAGRPPVTNMYESVIWVSFAVTLFGLIFFARYRAPIYLLAALPVSLVSLLLVHQMPVAMPSSIDPLVPVLRDNFWLTVHVLTITLSYAAFALAMGFGHILLWRYARNPAAARADQPMHFWLYRVLQLGVLLLAAGTILGGVWANYSWGRFWGWDPKETWALIALLTYILTLHGRLAGWWTQFGLVVASVVCFLAVLFAWYGVNFVLGKGLHSYGFGIGGESYVATFVVLDLLFVGFAVWRHRASTRRPAAQPVESETVPA